MAFECVLRAWHDHQAELRHFLLGRLKEPAQSDDLLQDVFLKAMREGQSFCELENPRSWLFRVARNALADSHRLRKAWVPVPDHLPDNRRAVSDPVADLDVCIRAVLPSLGDDDRDILEACDLGPLSQDDYAASNGISLPAAKARIRRARARLRDELARRCNVITDSSGKVCCHNSVADNTRTGH
ncbi:sigma-70 family RNA polymerase sigma factor [Marinobacter sp. HL-58]|uniref:sigma-70 family RNA polymerase sigma factor n=1 Tax=Marinobacter sp. HL-58 TaxID=1479237 RepID=UPI000565546D|nr:sigma-70 family RNA polymerase sigma factor [Marinobacter sp. HL-58]KPP97320.1 MAG: ECF subfamily RNA polymerase sigma 70 factor [Marinobacter sp. HL-58]